MDRLAIGFSGTSARKHLLFALLGLLGWAGVPSADDEGISHRAPEIEAIVGAAERYTRRYENVTVVGHCRILSEENGRETEGESFWFRILRRGDDLSAEKLDPLADEPIPTTPFCGSGSTEEVMKRFRLRSVVSKSDRYDLLLRQNAAGDGLSIRNINNDPASPSRGLFVRAAHAVLPAVDGPYAIYHVPVAALLSYEGCQATVSPSRHSGDTRVTFRCTPAYSPEGFLATITGGSARLVDGEIVFRESDGWVLTSQLTNMRLEGNEKVALSVSDTVRYEPCTEDGGQPIPALMTHVRRIPDKRSVMTVVISVAAIEFGHLQASDFHLAAYGLPEPAGISDGRWSMGMLDAGVWFIAVGVLLLCVGLLWGRRRAGGSWAG